MLPEIKLDIVNDDLIYKWKGNKARRNRRVRIQKAKRALRRLNRMKLQKELKGE